MKSKKVLGGFTLIELLAVISIIGILSAITIGSFGEARRKSRITKRIADLKQVQLALEMYRAKNGSYPISAGTSECSGHGNNFNVDVIPGLAPLYLSRVPTDPMMNASTNENCYIYFSNGTDYKFLDHNLTDMTLEQIRKYPELIDPCRSGNMPPPVGITDTCIWRAPNINSFSVGTMLGNVTW